MRPGHVFYDRPAVALLIRPGGFDVLHPLGGELPALWIAARMRAAPYQPVDEVFPGRSYFRMHLILWCLLRGPRLRGRFAGVAMGSDSLSIVREFLRLGEP